MVLYTAGAGCWREEEEALGSGDRKSLGRAKKRLLEEPPCEEERYSAQRPPRMLSALITEDRIDVG